MLINLSDVLSDQHKTVDETVPLTMDVIHLQSGEYPVVSSEPVHVRAEHIKGKELLIKADTVLTVLIPCDRCLEEVRYDFVLNCTRHIDLGLSDAELTEELDESNFIDGYHLDVDKLLFPEILSIRDLILECQLSVTYLRILRRCNLCQSVQRINLQRQEEIREELTGR